MIFCLVAEKGAKEMNNMKNKLADFINNNAACHDIHIDLFNEDEIKFYYDCLIYSEKSHPEVDDLDENGDWRNKSSTEYGKAFDNGKVSITPLSRREVVIILLKWGKALHDILLGGAAAAPILVYSVATDIPVLFSHVKLLRTREEQCVFFQISLLASNSPKTAVSFDDLVSFDFTVSGGFKCPYQPEKCLFLDASMENFQCRKHVSAGDFNDPLLGVLEQLEKNGVIKFNRIARTINIL